MRDIMNQVVFLSFPKFFNILNIFLDVLQEFIRFHYKILMFLLMI